MRLYAWAHGLSPLAVASALEPFPGLGAVLNHPNYRAALLPTAHETRWIAYVNGVTAAKKLAIEVADGAVFQAIIVMDERNTTGPSGHYLHPAEYSKTYREIKAHLPAGIPVSTMGLATRTNWWQRLIWRGRYDDWYHERLPAAVLRSGNTNKMGRRELERVINLGVSVLSPAVFRGWFYGFMQPVKAREWVRISRDPRVFAVCIWSLVEVDNQPHGLLTPGGELTSIGRAVKAAINQSSRS